ncbi:PqqD family protein [Streptomyces rubiginosohelvolus]|uniref:PqqD family protein n=1 Tax=Streptomyces rubiginosohelvolus TaxID=67362 RepID=UPI0036A1178C
MRNYRGVLLVSGPLENYELTDSAEFIFRAVDGDNSVEQIGAMLSEHYEVPFSDAVNDVAEFIADLVENRIIEIV